MPVMNHQALPQAVQALNHLILVQAARRPLAEHPAVPLPVHHLQPGMMPVTIIMMKTVTRILTQIRDMYMRGFMPESRMYGWEQRSAKACRMYKL